MKRFLGMICFALLTLGIDPTLMAQQFKGDRMATPADMNGDPSPGPTQIQWYTNYNQALQAAQKTRKPILLFFTGSDWCGWCKKMQQEIFSSPDFVREAGGAFIFVDIDFPMNKQLPPELAQQNTQLKQKYGVTGYPTVIILDYNQNFVAETGYRPGGGKSYADYLRQLLK